ncbi:MAG: c-type cytochrome [Methylomonas sp.]
MGLPHGLLRIHSICVLALAALELLAPLNMAIADPVAESLVLRVGSGNPVAGKEKAEAGRCLECHGSDGNSGDVRIPNHAGQYAAYLIKQLRDFQSGARKHAVMTVMAEDLDETDMADIASYFASRRPMQGEKRGDYPLAKNLFVNGDPARNIAACAGCHGGDGKGKIVDRMVYPVIAGQNRVYLHGQLTSWKLGERTNSPDAVMNKVARLLSDDEIEALANYLAGM